MLDENRFRAGSVRFDWARDANRVPKPQEGVLTVLVDTREQDPPPFPKGVVIQRFGQSEGDYTTPLLLTTGCVERKSGPDFVHSFTHDHERVMREITRLQSYEWKAIVVEMSLSDCLKLSQAHPDSIRGRVASLLADFDCPVLFVDSAYACGRVIAGLLRRWEKRFGALLPTPPLANQLRDAMDRMTAR